MFTGFLNEKRSDNNYYFYGYNFDSKSWESQRFQFLDFIWTTDVEYDGGNKIFQMKALRASNSKIYFQHLIVIIDYQNKIFIDDRINSEEITSKSIYSYAYFNHDTKLFYWMSCNTISDFKSGYSTNPINDVKDKNYQSGKVNNDDSPFRFLDADSFTIKNIKMIRNTKYVYYEIQKNSNEIYYGIIDIELNKIIFNTNENLSQFKPYQSNGMFAFTNNTVYKVCAYKNGNNCLDTCSDNYTLDTENGNTCGTQNCSNFLLYPENICINYCDKDIYSIGDDGKKCGLCQDLYKMKKFKKFGVEGCFYYKPDNYYYLYEKYNIIKECSKHCASCESNETCQKCEDGYEKSSDGTCIKECYKNCKECEEYSDDEQNQKCTKCNENYYLEEDKKNCVKDCSSGYYKNETYCSKCDSNCKECSKGSTIENGKINPNCDSCEDDKFLVNATNYTSICVDNCPEGTNITETDNKICREIKNGIEENDNVNKEEQKYNLLIFFMLIIIYIFLILIYIFKIGFFKKRIDSEEIEQILN